MWNKCAPNEENWSVSDVIPTLVRSNKIPKRDAVSPCQNHGTPMLSTLTEPDSGNLNCKNEPTTGPTVHSIGWAPIHLVVQRGELIITVRTFGLVLWEALLFNTLRGWGNQCIR